MLAILVLHSPSGYCRLASMPDHSVSSAGEEACSSTMIRESAGDQ